MRMCQPDLRQVDKPAKGDKADAEQDEGRIAELFFDNKFLIMRLPSDVSGSFQAFAGNGQHCLVDDQGRFSDRGPDRLP